jgi:two-component system, NtrC family, nitrogen regulation sensor histidine kinase NtrY
MSFRAKVFLIFLVTVLASVSLVAYGVTYYTQRSFEQRDAQLTKTLLTQSQKEFEQRNDVVVQQVENITNSDATIHMAIDLARGSDPSIYVHDANGAAQTYGLDFVEFVNYEGALISSTQNPARVGYKVDWVTAGNWDGSKAFFRREELVEGAALSLTAIRVCTTAPKPLYIIGGRRLDQNFLASLALPGDMHALLYRNLEDSFVPNALTDSAGPVHDADRFERLITELQKQSKPEMLVRTIQWTNDAESAETFHAMPLTGRNNELLGVLLLGSPHRELVLLRRQILKTAALVALAAICIGLLLSWWVSKRITRPVEELANGARDVASGRWDTQIDVQGSDEVGQLAEAFNHMTRTLASQKEKLVQTERVAAWRELARRLAHELRNPLFPLQITVENLHRARQLGPAQFQEVFNEATATLKAELSNLNSIVGRFSDFSKMPAPHFARVNVNEALRNAVRLFEPQFTAVGKPAITTEYFLNESLPEIDADPDLLHRAFQNLVLNALDAMPAGGTLTLRTSDGQDTVRIEVADTGKGLTPEECSRLFTPYYTTKQLGTGLGLAIVQSVVADHHGTISVSSEEGRGATFRIDFPKRQPGASPKPKSSSAPGVTESERTAAASD